MRRAVFPISMLALALGLLGGVMWWLFAGQRDDVATARMFLRHLASGDHAAAHALMTPALAEDLPVDLLNAEFSGIEEWDHLGFSNRITNGFGPARLTEIYGRGTSITGCESGLVLRLISGEVDALNITPLCRSDSDET